MKTIYKYLLHHGVDTQVSMSRGCIPRRVAMQNGALCLWAEVDTDIRPATRTFRIIGTGHAIPENGCYIGSCDDGPFVWHVLELI